MGEGVAGEGLLEGVEGGPIGRGREGSEEPGWRGGWSGGGFFAAGGERGGRGGGGAEEEGAPGEGPWLVRGHGAVVW